MKSGMLWWDADPKKLLSDKINEAAARYYRKFGLKPDLCFANAADLKTFALGRDPLTYRMPCMVQPSKTVMPNHVWLGVEEPKPAPAPTEDEIEEDYREKQGGFGFSHDELEKADYESERGC